MYEMRDFKEILSRKSSAHFSSKASEKPIDTLSMKTEGQLTEACAMTP